MKRPENDPAVLAVSLKLANIYYSWGDYDKAELGYKFCLDSQRKNYETSLVRQISRPLLFNHQLSSFLESSKRC